MQIWYCDSCKLLFPGSLTTCPSCSSIPKLELRRGQDFYLRQGYTYYSGEIQAAGNHPDGDRSPCAQGGTSTDAAGRRTKDGSAVTGPGGRQPSQQPNLPRNTGQTQPEAEPDVRQPSQQPNLPRNAGRTSSDAIPGPRQPSQKTKPSQNAGRTSSGATPGPRQPSKSSFAATIQPVPGNRAVGRPSPPPPGKSTQDRITTGRSAVSSPAENRSRNGALWALAIRFGGWIVLGTAIFVLILLCMSWTPGGKSDKQDPGAADQSLPAAARNETGDQEPSRSDNASPVETVKSTSGSGGILKTIDPITDNIITIDAIGSAEAIIPSLTVGYFSGSMSFDGQTNDHSFSPTVSGTYRFEFTDIEDGVDFRLWICNANGDPIKSDSDMDTGDGVTVSLDSGSSYIIRVGQYRRFGAYTLIIGEQKPTVDVSDLTKVSDAVQYTDQENNYLLSPSVGGTYRFEFSDVPDGTDLSLYVFNSGWERIASDYDMDNGDGLTVTLEKGKSYYIRAEQYRSLGGYSLIIGKQKETADVTAYTMLSDSIQYTDQRNNYRLAAAVEGTYRFEFANVPDGTDLRLYIYNSGWETIESDYDMDNGDGLTVSLSEGQTIYITVSQYRSLGTYSLILGTPKPMADVTDTGQLSDSVQYTEQRNVYVFEAKTAGAYSFTLSSVPDGVYFRMQIYNSGWESVDHETDMDSGDGLSADLSQGQIVYVCISQYKGTGNYSLTVSKN